MLCRYRGSGQIKPKLSRMGGSDWENTKTRVKKEVESIAYDLLRLYARRKMQEGIAFAEDSPLQLEMEEAFEYIETPDQNKAINDIKEAQSILCQGLIALIDSRLTGNNEENLKKTKDDMIKYLAHSK